MIYIVNINNKEYEVEVEKGQANLIKTTEVVTLAPVAVNLVVENPQVQTSVPVIAINSIGGEPIKAPMPGTLLDIKVSVGTKVKKGQILFVLEAMKMENEIFAPSDGVVTQIMFAKSSTVATDDIIMIIQ